MSKASEILTEEAEGGEEGGKEGERQGGESVVHCNESHGLCGVTGGTASLPFLHSNWQGSHDINMWGKWPWRMPRQSSSLLSWRVSHKPEINYNIPSLSPSLPPSLPSLDATYWQG